MTNATIYHNPRCSKSRGTLSLLQGRGVAVAEVRYLDNPPDAATLRRIVKMLGVPTRDLVRTKEHAELGLPACASDEAWIEQIIAHPAILQRPIVVTAKGAAIGRPPENVLSILS